MFVDWNFFSMVKVFMRIVERAAIIVNITYLVVYFWKLHKSIDLYNVRNHLFVWPSFNKNRIYKIIAWKTYQMLLLKIKMHPC